MPQHIAKTDLTFDFPHKSDLNLEIGASKYQYHNFTFLQVFSYTTVWLYFFFWSYAWVTETLGYRHPDKSKSLCPTKVVGSWKH